MKYLLKTLFVSFIYSLTIFGQDNTTPRFEKYYANYCNKEKIKNISKAGAYLACSGDEVEPKLNGEKELSAILKKLETQNLVDICRQNDDSIFTGFDEIVLGDKVENLLTLPADRCSCNIRINAIRNKFCTTPKENLLGLPSRHEELELLLKLDKFENYDEAIKECATYIFGKEELQKIQEHIKSIKINFNLSNPSNSKVLAITDLIADSDTNTIVPLTCEDKFKKEHTSFENNIKSNALDLTLIDGTKPFELRKSLEVFNCLTGQQNEKENLTSVVAQHVVQRVQQISLDPDLAIEEDDSPEVKNSKYAIQERRNNYKEAVEKTTILSSELNDLTDRLQNVKSEKELNAIYKRISEIKTELKSLGKYGYSYKDHSTKFKDLNKKISSIAKDRGYKIEDYEESNSNIASSPRNNQKRYSDDQVLKKFPGTSINSDSSVVSESTNKPYVPVYAPKKEVKRTNIAPPSRAETEKIRNEERSAKAQAVKNNISSTFASAPSSQNTRSSSSGRSPASVSGGSTNIKTYEIPNLNKEPEVLNNKDFPKIKVIFVDDKKIMKLFKFEDKSYKLKEEITKEDFIENFESFPESVREQGSDFFKISRAKALSN